MTKSILRYLLLIFVFTSVLSCSKNFLFINQVKIIERGGKLEIYDTKLKRLNGSYLIYNPYEKDKLIECNLKNGVLNGNLKVFIKNSEFKIDEYKTKSSGLTKTMKIIPKQYSILNKEIEYKDGIPSGVAKEFYSNGDLKRLVEIINDSIISYKHYDSKNQLINENLEKFQEFFNLELPVKENLID